MLFCFGLILVQSHRPDKTQASSSKHTVSTGIQTEAGLSGSPAPATPLQPVTPPAASTSDAAPQANTKGDNISQPKRLNSQPSASGSNQDGNLVKELLNKL
jgi:hypothetical protein